MTGPVAIHCIGSIYNNLQSCAPSATSKTTPVTETINVLVYCGYNDLWSDIARTLLTPTNRLI